MNVRVYFVAYTHLVDSGGGDYPILVGGDVPRETMPKILTEADTKSYP